MKNSSPTTLREAGALTDSSHPEYKKSAVRHTCPVCNTPNGAKMYKLRASGNRVTWLHAYCITKLSGMPSALQWCEKNLPFNLSAVSPHQAAAPNKEARP